MCWALIESHWPISSFRSARTRVKNSPLCVVSLIVKGVNLWLSQQLCYYVALIESLRLGETATSVFFWRFRWPRWTVLCRACGLDLTSWGILRGILKNSARSVLHNMTNGFLSQTFGGLWKTCWDLVKVNSPCWVHAPGQEHPGASSRSCQECQWRGNESLKKMAQNDSCGINKINKINKINLYVLRTRYLPHSSSLFHDSPTPWVDRSMFPSRDILGRPCCATQIAVKTALLGGFKQTEHNYLQHAKKTDDSSGTTARAPRFHQGTQGCTGWCHTQHACLESQLCGWKNYGKLGLSDNPMQLRPAQWLSSDLTNKCDCGSSWQTVPLTVSIQCIAGIE